MSNDDHDNQGSKSTPPSRVNHFDKLLATWPQTQPPGGFDQLATKISNRIERGDDGMTFSELSDEKIVASPIGQTPEDGHNSRAFRESDETQMSSEDSSMTTSSDQRQRDRQSLKDLAKLATASNAQLPSTHDLSADDSGMVDLKTVAQLTGLLGADVAKPVTPYAAPPSSGSLAFVRTASVPPAPSTQPLINSRNVASAAAFAPTVPVEAVQPAPVSHTPTLISTRAAELVAPAIAAAAPAVQIAAPIAEPIAYSVVDTSEIQEVRSSKKGVVIVLAALVASAAIAAGGVVFVSKMHKSAPIAQRAPIVETTPVVNTIQAAPAPVAPVVETAPVAAAAAADDLTFAPADPNAALDPASLPLANAKGAKVASAHHAVAAKIPAKAAPIAAVAEAPKAEVKAAEPAPAPEPPKVAAAPAKKGEKGDLTDAMRTAAGPIEAHAAVVESGPAFAAGTVPQKPSQGALTSALGAVLPAARSCLSPDDAVAKATIVFSSVGKVDSVSVHGGPAGKGECIKGALQKAKIQPFMDANYTANITVRP